MSIEALRVNCIKAFQERADGATTRAMNMDIRPAGQHIAATTAEEYALTSVRSLTEARAFLEAMRIVQNEFMKLTQPEEKAEKVVEIPTSKRSLY